MGIGGGPSEISSVFLLKYIPKNPPSATQSPFWKDPGIRRMICSNFSRASTGSRNRCIFPCCLSVVYPRCEKYSITLSTIDDLGLSLWIPPIGLHFLSNEYFKNLIQE